MTKTKTTAKNNTIRGPLYALLKKVFLADFPAKIEPKELSVKDLSIFLEVTNQDLYRWLRNNRIPSKRAKLFIDKSKEKIKSKDLIPFIITE